MIGPLTHQLKHSSRIIPKLGSSFHKPHFPKLVNLNLEKPNLNVFFCANFHHSVQNWGKIFVDTENHHAYNSLPQIQKFQPTWDPPGAVQTVADLNEFLDRNWRGSTAPAIVEAFERIKEIIIANNINLSDPRFDKLVDGLMDHCEKLTDDDLHRLLTTLTEYPQCEALESHNFHDVWCCLDDICCWKMGNWGLQKLYSFAEVWYKWNLGRRSDYLYEVLDKVTNRPKRLSKNMLVYTFFFLNVHRKKTFPFELEQAVVDNLEEFSTEELAVIAMGFFKTTTKIKTPSIVSAMIRAISDNCEGINEMTLTALLKVIRLSQRQEVAPEIPPMLDKLMAQLPRFSTMALIHIALLGTTLQIKHEESVKKCAEMILVEMPNIRLKDIERILAACAMFGIETHPSIYEGALEEIQKDTRRKEVLQYRRCLPSILNYLSLRKIYSFEYMEEVFDEEVIHEVYGKNAKYLPRDLFSLDMCIDIECPDYGGCRLTPVKRYKAAKWLTEFTPTRDQFKRLSFAERSYLNVAESVVSLVGDEKLLRHDHVLPHFSKSDIILCKSKATGEFVEPFGFERYILGDVKRPADLENYKWFALVVMTPNLVIRDTSLPLGLMVMKERQLKTVGYNPVFIYTHTFANLTASEKLELIRNQLH